MLELGSGAVDRWVIIIAVLHLLIRASLTLSLSLIPLSFPSPHLPGEGDKLMCWMKCQAVEHLEDDNNEGHKSTKKEQEKDTYIRNDKMYGY